MSNNNYSYKETWWETALAGLAMLFLLAMIVAFIIILDIAWNEPEKRCFSTAIKEMDYCRDQTTWELPKLQTPIAANKESK